MSKYIAAPVTAGILLALAGAAQADTKNATFTVSATVAKACAIGAGNLIMGAWSGVGDLTGKSTVSVKCTTGTAYTVDLSPGADSTLADRKLKSGTDLLSYNLFLDADSSQIWGDGNDGTFTVGGNGTGMADAQNRPIDVHARVLEADLLAAKPGTYTNIITATVTY